MINALNCFWSIKTFLFPVLEFRILEEYCLERHRSIESQDLAFCWGKASADMWSSGIPLYNCECSSESFHHISVRTVKISIAVCGAGKGDYYSSKLCANHSALIPTEQLTSAAKESRMFLMHGLVWWMMCWAYIRLCALVNMSSFLLCDSRLRQALQLQMPLQRGQACIASSTVKPGYQVLRHLQQTSDSSTAVDITVGCYSQLWRSFWQKQPQICVW